MKFLTSFTILVAMFAVCSGEVLAQTSEPDAAPRGQTRQIELKPEAASVPVVINVALD